MYSKCHQLPPEVLFEHALLLEKQTYNNQFMFFLKMCGFKKNRLLRYEEFRNHFFFDDFSAFKQCSFLLIDGEESERDNGGSMS